MSLVIINCNNDKCHYWRRGMCIFHDAGLSKYAVMVRRFDYDHNHGRLICRDCKED